MKIVATSDTHFPLTNPLLFPDGDILVIAGDVLYAGNEREWYKFLESLQYSHIQKYKHKVFVPGNHDLYFQYYSGGCIGQLKDAGFESLTPSRPKITIDGVRFGGSPFVTGLPNWAYNIEEEDLWKYLDGLGRVDVLVSHSPPRGVMDSDGVGNYGTQALRKYLAKYEPEVVICGHVHEGYGTQVVGKTRVHNVAQCERTYTQVNPAHEIEV